jgi:hypothetical protein
MSIVRLMSDDTVYEVEQGCEFVLVENQFGIRGRCRIRQGSGT